MKAGWRELSIFCWSLWLYPNMRSLVTPQILLHPDPSPALVDACVSFCPPMSLCPSLLLAWPSLTPPSLSSLAQLCTWHPAGPSKLLESTIQHSPWGLLPAPRTVPPDSPTGPWLLRQVFFWLCFNLVFFLHLSLYLSLSAHLSCLPAGHTHTHTHPAASWPVSH